MSEQEKPETKDAAQESFRRGNINFDLLEPEYPAGQKGKHHDKIFAEDVSGKRGIFDRQINQKPVGTVQISVWLVLFTGSLYLLYIVLFIARSLFWILGLPLILITLLWSFIMLVLFKVRPR